MIRFILTLLMGTVLIGCAVEPEASHRGRAAEADVIELARQFAQDSAECEAVLEKYPGILERGQELSSQAPNMVVAFDHDAVIGGVAETARQTRLNVRILVTMAGGELKGVEVKETKH
ncbi:MAG: hypothetical protein CMJ49_13010 [Planctomycetaceae bacterium]|nr:hypothetical protein [Planctomycetaceae bacterium]